MCRCRVHRAIGRIEAELGALVAIAIDGHGFQVARAGQHGQHGRRRGGGGGTL